MDIIHNSLQAHMLLFESGNHNPRISMMDRPHAIKTMRNMTCPSGKSLFGFLICGIRMSNRYHYSLFFQKGKKLHASRQLRSNRNHFYE
ncbi:hypothetical protein D3C76_1235970 [compost metagenome]